MKWLLKLFAIPLFFIALLVNLNSLLAANDKTKLEEIAYYGSAKDLEKWLKDNNNLISSNHPKIWEALNFRFNFIDEEFVINDPLAKETDKKEAKDKIKSRSQENLIMAELIFKAADQKSLDLLNTYTPPDEYPELPFLYDICLEKHIPISIRLKFVKSFIDQAKGKIWFDDVGLFLGYFKFLAALNDKEALECNELVAENFTKEEDWPKLQNKEQLRSLIKKVSILYKNPAFTKMPKK